MSSVEFYVMQMDVVMCEYAWQGDLLLISGIPPFFFAACSAHATRLASSSLKYVCAGFVSIHRPTESIIVHRRPCVMTERMTETPRLREETTSATERRPFRVITLTRDIVGTSQRVAAWD